MVAKFQPKTSHENITFELLELDFQTSIEIDCEKMTFKLDFQLIFVGQLLKALSSITSMN